MAGRADPVEIGDLVRDADGRPVAALPRGRLFLLAFYWLGISCIFSGLQAILTSRLEFERMVTRGTEGSAYLQMVVLGSLLAIVVQPTVGNISDYTVSRWGRRRPYIVIGACLDVIFLAGIATSNTVISIAAFYLLLQLSANTAQGPYQGYVPDMVPAAQVGFASALVGLLQTLGNVLGFAVGAIGTATGQYAIATIALGLIELATMTVMVLGVHEPIVRHDRGNRSWARIAVSAWGLDVLRERSFVWLVASRLFALMGMNVLLNLVVFYLSRCFGLDKGATGTMLFAMTAIVAVATMATVVPAARLSDRIGRKRVIVASCATGAAGLLVVAGSPLLALSFVGVTLVGIATGMFLSVDWALLTEIVPKVSSGRYMGISNVATASSGVLAIAIGGLVMDFVGGASADPSGPRAAMLLGAVWFGLGALLLQPVREPVRTLAARLAAS